ncbi:HD domain-containing protein [Roseomonas sp. BN140053]|uniref:HD domain-containing protein n=1 Tax=Roseomonas sp. BN140053 TaxID=3391898 RepID=UPI0039EB78CA
MIKEPTLVMMLPDHAPQNQLPHRHDAVKDIDAMVAALGLQGIRRYMDQKHWARESELARAADKLEPGLKLENVAAHSWHVADAIMLLASHFPSVDIPHALELAILHDKLELITGDYDPVGPDGQGTGSHAFDPTAQAGKVSAELVALECYLSNLREPIREWQRSLILEIIQGASPEARLVKAVDKLQALTFVLAKKHGTMTNEHLVFSLRYSAKVVEHFPDLAVHFGVLVDRLLETTAAHRGVSPEQISAELSVPLRALVAAAHA